MDGTLPVRALYYKFIKVVSWAANFEQASNLLDNRLNNVNIEVEKMLLGLQIKCGATDLKEFWFYRRSLYPIKHYIKEKRREEKWEENSFLEWKST